MGYKHIIIASIIALFLAASVSAEITADSAGTMIVNSQDWKDVYSGMLFASLAGTKANFLVSDKHSTLILNQFSQGATLNLVNSQDVPFVYGYGAIVEAKGYNADAYNFDNVNLELAKLSNKNSFIIIDDSYGYNAISVAPYAVVSDSYVLFVDADNVDEVDDFLQERGVANMIIYGIVDREVRNIFAKYDPETINEEGDRFANNIQIVKKYQELKSAKQVILTNGEFIESEIMSGEEPVIFIGTGNVPDQVREFIQDSPIEIGVLIGNELISTATFIRRQIGISVFVKFAQGARQPRGAVSQVEALDMFYLPAYVLNLELVSVKYNQATQKLEVTLRNPEEQAVYAKGTYSLTSDDGTTAGAGDDEAIFIDGNEVKTITYDMDTLTGSLITGNAYIIYGESPGSMERTLDESFEVEIITVKDDCEIELTSLEYDKTRDRFYIGIENTGPVDCYVDVEIIDVFIAGEKNTFSLANTASLKVGQKRELRINAELEEEDILDNEEVKVRAYYGEREDGLIKVKDHIFKLTLRGPDYVFYSLLIIIIIMIILIIWKRKKDKEKQQ